MDEYLESRRERKRSKEQCDKSTSSKPKDAPAGTKLKDESGLGKDDVHDIKKGVGAGARDWTGIAPNGDVITTNPGGGAENHGPYGTYLP